jgi:hypothetical protein
MAYFFYSSDQRTFELFVSRFSFFEDGIWIEGIDHLRELLQSGNEDFRFLLHFTGRDSKLDKFILQIRKSAPKAKLILVADRVTAAEMKAHQSSKAGADAYVAYKVDESMLRSILDGLGDQELNLHGNRLESTGVLSQDFTDLSHLPNLKENPASKELDGIFKEAVPPPYKSVGYQKIDNLKSDENYDHNEIDLAEGAGMSDKDQDLSLDDLEELELGEGELPGGEAPASDPYELDLDEAPALPMDDMQDMDSPDFSMDLPPEEDEFTKTEIDALTSTSVYLDESEGMEADEDEILLEDEASGDDEEEEEKPKSAQKPNRTRSLLAVDDAPLENIGELDFSLDDQLEDSSENSLEDELVGMEDSSSEESDEAASLDLNMEMTGSHIDLGELSDDAKEKLKEIDAIMDLDASQANIALPDLEAAEPVEDDEGLDLFTMEEEAAEEPQSVEEEADAGFEVGLDFGSDVTEAGGVGESSPVEGVSVDELEFDNDQDDRTRIAPMKLKPAPVEQKEPVAAIKEKEYDSDYTTVFSGDLERAQATIANLRADREELLAKVQKLEEDKMLQNRQSLTIRAELDEKKIELSIVRKKLNDEINEFKDRIRVLDEKRLVLEEKNRYLSQELDKAGQKTKIDIKKVQMRERELEQKLELLKQDAETQIRNRDLKILELKRKIDAMEFDMESISMQEKKSVASRFELEDKLGKAIKTLRGAISVLEEDGEKAKALDAIKKSIDN